MPTLPALVLPHRSCMYDDSTTPQAPTTPPRPITEHPRAPDRRLQLRLIIGDHSSDPSLPPHAAILPPTSLLPLHKQALVISNVSKAACIPQEFSSELPRDPVYSICVVP